MRRSFGAVVIMAWVAACDTGASSGDTDTTSGDTDTTSGDTDVTTDVTFADVQTQAFASCGSGFGPATCHGSAPYQGDLDLMSANAYDDLVNVQSLVGGLRVKPGSPDESLLWLKLTNTLPDDGSLGEPMPRGEAIQWSSISQEDLDLVRAWILAGAPR